MVTNYGKEMMGDCHTPKPGPWTLGKMETNKSSQIISQKLRHHHPPTRQTYLESSERVENPNPEPFASEGKWSQMMENI